jgi:hypothetical protein
MMLQLKGMGLAASASPFAEGRWKPAPPTEPSLWRRLLARINGPRRPTPTPAPPEETPDG